MYLSNPTGYPAGEGRAQRGRAGWALRGGLGHSRAGRGVEGRVKRGGSGAWRHGAFRPGGDFSFRYQKLRTRPSWKFLQKHGQRKSRSNRICHVQNPDIPRAGRGGKAHGGRQGGAVRGRTRCRRDGLRRKQPPLLPPRPSKATVFNDFPEARTNEFLRKPMGEQSQRVSVWPAVGASG